MVSVVLDSIAGGVELSEILVSYEKLVFSAETVWNQALPSGPLRANTGIRPDTCYLLSRANSIARTVDCAA